MEQIESVDKMIIFHKWNPSPLMPEQYEYRKKLLFNELLQELSNMDNDSEYSFKLIYLAINKYYPAIASEKTVTENAKSRINKQLKVLQELEAALVA